MLNAGQEDPKSLLARFFPNLEAFELYIIKKDFLQIEDVRYLQNLSLQSTVKEKSIIFLTFHKIGLEAQNALLKVLEELPEKKMFFLNTGQEDTLLDTLRSRLQSLNLPAKSKNDSSAVKDFLDLNMDKRLAFLDNLRKKDKEKLAEFLDSFEYYLAKNLHKPGARKALENLLSFRRADNLAAQPHKALLESLAFVEL